MDGVAVLVKSLGYKPEEYKMGRYANCNVKCLLNSFCGEPLLTSHTFVFLRTKIFIRFPKTLFATEDALEVRKHSIGLSILLSCSKFTIFILVKLVLVVFYHFTTAVIYRSCAMVGLLHLFCSILYSAKVALN